jgi:hypothetical protein
MIASGLAAWGTAHCGVGRGFAADEEWKPTRHVEVVVGVATGGSMDRTARSVDEALRKAGITPSASVVLNKLLLPPLGETTEKGLYVSYAPANRDERQGRVGIRVQATW